MEQAEPDFYSDPAVIQDPRGYFDAMRAKCPVTRDAHRDTLMVTGYDAALEVLNDRDGVFSNACSVVGPIPGLPFVPTGADIRAQLDQHRNDMPWAGHLVCMDGQTHVDHRALLANLLTRTRLKQNETYLTELADRLIDGFIVNGTCAIVPDYAHALTVYAICDLMGIPEADRAELLDLIGAPPSQIDGDAAHKIGSDPLIFMKARFDQYLRDRIAEPRSDLMSDLVRSRFRNGEAPVLDVLSRLARFLFGAGQDTTSRLIAMATLMLAEDPALQARLRAEPARIAAFIEEVLRYETPVKVSYRLAVEDTVVAATDVPAGTIVAVALYAASNDPAHFERPDRFDIDRPRVRDHMGFSRGAHACPGAPLGRMEARIAIERLLARATDIRVCEAQHGPPDARRFRFEPTYTFRSLAELHITFKAAC